MSDKLKQFQHSLQLLRGTREDLYELSLAFHRTGNQVVFDELCEHVRDLDFAIEKIRDSYDSLQRDALHGAQQTMGGLLSVALKMDEMERKG